MSALTVACSQGIPLRLIGASEINWFATATIASMRLVLLGLAPWTILFAQNNFVGAMGGISTLSADARIEGSPPERTSAYKPENGPAILLFGGRHFGDYFSAQLSFGWNRNDLLLSGSDLAMISSFDLPTRVAMHSVVAEAMVFFRPRSSRLRPYLSAGPGVVLSRVEASGPARLRGSPVLPSVNLDSTQPAVRVAVGIDFRVHSSVRLRYSFSETIQRNTLSRALSPRGERNLANFQNWWGLAWTF